MKYSYLFSFFYWWKYSWTFATKNAYQVGWSVLSLLLCKYITAYSCAQIQEKGPYIMSTVLLHHLSLLEYQKIQKPKLSDSTSYLFLFYGWLWSFVFLNTVSIIRMSSFVINLDCMVSYFSFGDDSNSRAGAQVWKIWTVCD